MRLQDEPYLRATDLPSLVRQLDSLYRATAQQVNGLSEGRLVASYQAATAAPTTGTWAVGDFVRNSAPAELGSAGNEYVILGWICTVSGTPGTWVAARAMVDDVGGGTAAATGVIGCTFDGGGAVIAPGAQCDVIVPFDCTITKATLLADQSGSVVIDVWSDAYASFPPTVGDAITSSTPPTISSAAKSEDATLTGWSTAITAGTTLRFNVNSCTTITRVLLSLEVLK